MTVTTLMILWKLNRFWRQLCNRCTHELRLAAATWLELIVA